jgi:hypothetical protein
VIFNDYFFSENNKNKEKEKERESDRDINNSQNLKENYGYNYNNNISKNVNKNLIPNTNYPINDFSYKKKGIIYRFIDFLFYLLTNI